MASVCSGRPASGAAPRNVGWCPMKNHAHAWCRARAVSRKAGTPSRSGSASSDVPGRFAAKETYHDGSPLLRRAGSRKSAAASSGHPGGRLSTHAASRCVRSIGATLSMPAHALALAKPRSKRQSCRANAATSAFDVSTRHALASSTSGDGSARREQRRGGAALQRFRFILKRKEFGKIK